MLATLTTIREYLQARLRVDTRSEAGQSVVEYLVLIVGAAIIAAAVVTGVTLAVNGKLGSLKL